MAFDVQGALKEGYSPTEIADFLGQKKKFDVAGARAEGYSDDEIIAHLNPKKKEGVTGSLQKGAEQLVSSVRTAAESIYKSPEEAALAAQKRGAEIEGKYGEGPSLEKLKQTYAEKGFFPAAGELISQIPTAIAEQAPNIGASLAGAGTGAMVAGPVGAVAGAFLPSLIQQYGGNIERQAQAQTEAGQDLDISRTKAIGAAVPMAALDVVGTFVPLGGRIATKVLGPEVGQLLTRGGAEAAEKLAKERLLTTIAKGTVTGVAAEVPTEVTQQMLERAQAGLSLTDETALKEYGETAFAVSLLGPIGIMGRVADKSAAGRDLALATQKAQETNQPQEVKLLTFDPNVPNSRGEEVMTVFPDGRVAPTEEAGFKERFEPTPIPGTTEATITPEADQAALQQRISEGFREQPAIQRLYKESEAANAAKAATSMFNPIVTPEAIKSFGVAPTAKIFKDPEVLNADLTNPESADKVREKLSALRDANSSDKVKTNIENYLNRPEFITPKFVEEYLNPPVEIAGEGTQQFAFYDPQTQDIKVVNGEVLDDGTKFKYGKNKPRNLDDNVLVNPNPDQMEAMLLLKQRAQLEKEPNDFRDFLNKSKIKSTELMDLMGTTKNVPSSLISREGQGIDVLVQDAIDAGILSEADFDFDRDPGGVEQMKDFIRATMAGERVPTPGNLSVITGLQQIDDRLSNIEQKLSGVPEEAIAAEQQFVPEEQAIPAGPVTPAEYATTEPVTPSFRAEIATPHSDKFLADRKKLFRDLRKQLDKMGLKDVGLKFEESIQEMLNGQMTEVNATYLNKLISVAMSGDNMVRTLNHEAIHAMKDLGFFSDRDWKLLTDMANKEWMQKYDIANPQRYGNQSKEIQIEEAIAHAFGDRQTQPQPVKSIMTRVLNFLKRIGNFLRARGFRTAEDVFTEAETGKLAPTKEATVTEARAEIPSKEKLKAALNDVDPDYAAKILKQFTQEKATVKEKFEGLKANFFDRMMTGLFDEFRAIKKYDEKSYMQARLSKSIDGALQGLLEHGQVFNDGGALNIRQGTKGLLQILEPVGQEVDQYQIWKALNRDANMSSDKRSFDPELVAGRDKLASGTLNGKPRKAIYEQVLKEENELNRSVLKVALDSGLIDKEGFNKFANDIYYIPFYKLMEDGDVQSVNTASKLTGQQFSKALKGGEKKVNDLMENVLMNWSHILSASMKNQAAQSTITAAESMGAAEPAEMVGGKYPAGTVKVMQDGQPVHYNVSDPDLVDAISTISYLGPKSAFLDVAKGFTNALRYGITMSPAYKVRNLIRDSIQSAAISDLGNNMFENVYNGLAMSKDGHPTFMAALAGGGIFEMGTAHEGNQAKLIKRLIDKGVNATEILDTPDKIKAKLQSVLDKYNEIGNKFENANRLALYQKLIDSGKSHLEASYAARDLMDFSMQGQFRAVKIIGSVVPFFNARLQGLYKLGRDGVTPTYRVICNATTGAPLEIGDKQKAARFMTISSAVMLASVLLYGMYKDDEDFQRREDWDRDNFWWFKIGDTAFRIPKPFEIGALGTIAERTYEQLVDEKVEGKVFTDRIHSMLADTFSLNPMPQMIKPMIDLYANKDSFTGAPIESGGMERLSKQERINNNTSGLAIALGGISQGAAKVLTFNPDAEGFSPVQVDYGIKAYFGWLGATAASTADLAVEPFTEGTKVRKPVVDTLAMGFVKTMPETQSKYMTQFYTNNARIQSALADMRHYAQLGENEKVEKILAEKGDDIRMAKLYDTTSKQLAKLRAQSRFIEQSKDIDVEDKRAEMNRLKILMSDLAAQVESVRKELKK